MTRVVVTVMPREGVLDPQGQAVQGALGRLGFAGIHDVRLGRRIELELDGPDPLGDAAPRCASGSWPIRSSKTSPSPIED